MAEDFMAMYKQALERLSTGGMSLEASLQEIEEGKKQAIGRGQQTLVSGGLGGTTVMGGVPLQAEKIASRQRLGARGRAEEKYLTTLASFAAFAQRGEEAQKQREFEARQAGLSRGFSAQQAELERIEQRGPKPGTAASPFDVFGRYKEGRGPTGDMGGAQPGGGYAQQFPSIYGQEGAAVPDWTGAGGVSGLSPAAEMFQTGAGDEGRFDIDFGPGTLVGDVGEQPTAAPVSEQPAGVPTSLAVGAQMGRMLGEPKTESYSPGDYYVGSLVKGGVKTSYYRTDSGRVVVGPVFTGR